MAVNLSGHHLRDVELPDEVARLLRTWNVAPTSLALEITESTIMAEPLRARSILTRLSAMGVKLAIDDFGAGYSSLAYLKRLSVDEIKIDKSFVINMAQDQGDAVIVRSTIDLAHNLGLAVVAEGVENEETCKMLAGLGCDAVQGYHLSRALPPGELTDWARKWRPTSVPKRVGQRRSGGAEDQVRPSAVA